MSVRGTRLSEVAAFMLIASSASLELGACQPANTTSRPLVSAESHPRASEPPAQNEASLGKPRSANSRSGGACTDKAGRTASGSALPLSLCGSTRYFTGADGNPFLLVGQASWALATRLKQEEASFYLNDQDRKSTRLNSSHSHSSYA